MHLTAPKKMIRVHIGYSYMLLDVTPENLALAIKLAETPAYTTNYTSEHGSTHHLTGGNVADTIEITDVTLSDLSRDDFDAAIAAARDEPVAQAAE